MRVLGIDPGLNIAGYGCVELSSPGDTPRIVEAGAIHLKRGASLHWRLGQLHTALSEIVAELRPDHLAVEQVFSHARQVRTAILLGHARGVILLAGVQANLPLTEFAPATIKKAIAGNGQATKGQMQHAVASILGLNEPPEPADVADALAIAITAATREAC